MQKVWTLGKASACESSVVCSADLNKLCLVGGENKLLVSMFDYCCKSPMLLPLRACILFENDLSVESNWSSSRGGANAGCSVGLNNPTDSEPNYFLECLRSESVGGGDDLRRFTDLFSFLDEDEESRKVP